MALTLTAEDIAAIIAAFPFPTVRVPELPLFSVYGDISVNDRIVMYMDAYNKTVKVPVVDFRTFMLTGGGLSHPPVVVGNSVYVEVSALEAGGKIFSIPSVAGKDFILRRGGVGAMDPAWYEVLDAGGFKLLRTDDFLTLGEQWELQLIGTSVSTGGGTGTTVTTSLLSGIKSVSANTTIGPSDIGKLIQIRANSAIITVTLPAIETIPANSIIIIETDISNLNQATIQTSGGQFIYFKGTALSKIYLGVSENVSLYRGEDGYYVINSFGNFLSVGGVEWRHKLGINEVLLDGSLVARASYPRLFEYAQTTSGSIVTDTEWNQVDADSNLFRKGCFSYGDGSTTFRLPDFMNSAIRSLKSTSGSDPIRQLNVPGGFQKDMVGPIIGPMTHRKGNSYTGGPNNDVFGNGNAGTLQTLTSTVSISTGNPETTMQNIGMLPVMKC